MKNQFLHLHCEKLRRIYCAFVTIWHHIFMISESLQPISVACCTTLNLVLRVFGCWYCSVDLCMCKSAQIFDFCRLCTMEKEWENKQYFYSVQRFKDVLSIFKSILYNYRKSERQYWIDCSLILILIMYEEDLLPL